MRFRYHGTRKLRSSRFGESCAAVDESLLRCAEDETAERSEGTQRAEASDEIPIDKFHLPQRSRDFAENPSPTQLDDHIRSFEETTGRASDRDGAPRRAGGSRCP